MENHTNIHRFCGEQMNWISVAERLPEKGKGSEVKMLFWDEYNIHFGYFWTYGDEPKWTSISDPYYGGEYRDVDNVTHWMPLPEPPK